MLATRKIDQLEMALKMAEASHANSRKEIERMKGIVTLAEEEKNKAQERLNPTYPKPPVICVGEALAELFIGLATERAF